MYVWGAGRGIGKIPISSSQCCYKLEAALKHSRLKKTSLSLFMPQLPQSVPAVCASLSSLAGFSKERPAGLCYLPSLSRQPSDFGPRHSTHPSDLPVPKSGVTGPFSSWPHTLLAF